MTMYTNGGGRMPPPSLRSLNAPYLQAFTVADLIRIENDRIWDRLGQRFDSVLSGSGEAYLLPWVHPVTDVDKLLQVPTVARATVDVSAGGAVAFTVPSGKRWTVLWIRREGTTDATALGFTIGGTGVSFQAASASAATFDMYRQVMDEGDYVSLTQGNVADTGVVIDISYLEEDAF